MIWPRKADVDDQVRRYAEQWQMSPELTDALLDLEPQCNWQHHAAGTYGCDPGAPGEYVIAIAAHCATRTPSRPKTIIVICQSQQIRLRGSLDETVQCGMCHVVSTWRDLIQFLGPVAEYHPST